MSYRSGGLSIQILKNHDEVSEIAALYMIAAILSNADARMIVSWGNTPSITHEKFVTTAIGAALNYKSLIIVQGDEVYGFPEDHPATGSVQIRRELGPLGINDTHRHVRFMSSAMDPYVECKRVEYQLQALGAIDLVIAGLGPNGHLFFIEDAREGDSGPYVSRLRKSTVQRPGFPECAIGLTVGLKNLRSAKKLIILATGEKKREQVRELVHGDIRPEFTAGIVRTWDNALLLTDDAAAADLDLEKIRPPRT